MNQNNITSVLKMLDAMSVEELNNVLVHLNERLNPHAVGVEVRLSETPGRGGRYEVLLIMKDGSEKVVKFRDRHSRLVYIYTLLHPKGYQRRSLTDDNYRALRVLFSKIYFDSAEPLLKAIGNDFDHYFSQAVAQSRRAIREAINASEDLEIALPQRHGGRTLIGLAANGGYVIIDSHLL